jgi:hypothetical protein
MSLKEPKASTMSSKTNSVASTERSRRLRERRAEGRMIVQVDLSATDLAIAQRLSGSSMPLTPGAVAEQMILGLRLVASTAPEEEPADQPRVQRGRGTWDDPLLSVRKPLVWS